MKQIIIRIMCVTLVVLFAATSIKTINSLKEQNSRLKSNQEILLTEKESITAKSQFYKVSDSLNAAKVTELQLSLSEYKKFRKQDLNLIERLKVNKSDLQKVISSQSETIFALTAQLKDSVDESSNPIRCFGYKSNWIDVSGCIGNDTIDLKIANRESLKVVETVKYKRFLGFLWKTNKVKSRQVDIISENPYTTITNVEAISIEQ